jgi:hypothetical protein
MLVVKRDRILGMKGVKNNSMRFLPAFLHNQNEENRFLHSKQIVCFLSIKNILKVSFFETTC